MLDGKDPTLEELDKWFEEMLKGTEYEIKKN